MITQNEWKKLGELIRSIVRTETKDIKKDIQLIFEELRLLKEQIHYLPTKKEYFDTMDKLMKEIQDLRDDNAILAGYKDQLEDHETRILRIEQRKNVL